MKRLLSLAAFGLFTLTGCSNVSPPGGNTAGGVTETFRIVAPAITHTIKKNPTGDAKENITITLVRGTNFNETLTVKTSDETKGIKAKITTPTTVKVGDSKEVIVEVTVDKDAPEGDHSFKFTAKPDKTTEMSEVVKIKVTK